MSSIMATLTDDNTGYIPDTFVLLKLHLCDCHYYLFFFYLAIYIFGNVQTLTCIYVFRLAVLVSVIDYYYISGT